MKIAIFTDTYFPDVNGVAKTLKRFTDYLEANGHEYRVFAPKTSKVASYSSQIYQLTSLPFFLYPECRFSIPNVLQVKAELKQFQPDIIHVATPFNVGLCGIHYAQKYNIPLVGSYHTDFDKYLAYYHLQLFSKTLAKYLDWFHRSMQKIFVPSLDTFQKLKAQGYPNLSIWGRGVDATLFQPSYDGNAIRKKYNIKEKFILSYVGRLAPEKDVDSLVAIMNTLPAHLSNQIHWIIVGDGPSKEDMIKSAPANVTFTGYLQGEALAEVYANSDTFVFPSSSETFGNVVLEALASGTPAIVANAGGVKHIVEHKKTGMLCEPGEIEGFVGAIDHLLQNDAERLVMGIHARQYALKQTWNQIFEKLLSEYEEAMIETYPVAKHA
ncbi:glycosyltransferase family 4 protein [Radiobacillus sp. PE A8.2]|uniref:glycosyltransferase family 4 protein n=1 Tax=Radiobacillus sp. PE A8.2 TaxID=3380349 RepID=UPI00388D6A1C